MTFHWRAHCVFCTFRHASIYRSRRERFYGEICEITLLAVPVNSRGQNSGLSAALHQASSVSVGARLSALKITAIIVGDVSVVNRTKTQDKTWLHCQRGNTTCDPVYFSFHVNVNWFVLKTQTNFFLYDAWNILEINVINYSSISSTSKVTVVLLGKVYMIFPITS